MLCYLILQKSLEMEPIDVVPSLWQWFTVLATGTMGIAQLMPVTLKRYSYILVLLAQTDSCANLLDFLFCFACTSGPSAAF